MKPRGKTGLEQWMGSRVLDIHTLLILCMEWITNENLLCSSGNSTWCSVVT